MRPPAAEVEPMQLASWFGEGQRRAASLGRPVLVSVAWPLQTPPNPLAFFAAAKRWGMRSFWARPNDGFWMVGSGAAAVVQGNGERSIESMSSNPLPLCWTRQSSNAPEDGAPAPYLPAAFVLTHWLTGTLCGRDSQMQA